MKRILLICFVLFHIAANAQDRVNREKLLFTASSEVLDKATGWAYDKELGEWIDYENVISADKIYKEKYKSLIGSYMMSHTYQNFISIISKSLSFKGENYNVLIVKKWGGRYKYPSIEEDWIRFRMIQCFMFKKEDFGKITSISDTLNLKTKYKVQVSEEFEVYTDSKLLDLIQTELSNEHLFEEYTFPIMKTDKGDIRFYLPEIFSGYYSDYDFNNRYFEIALDNFKKILIK